MALPDLYTLMMGGEPEAADMARAMAQAIRGNRQAALAGALGTQDAIGNMAKLQQANAAQDENLMEKGLTARMHYGEQARNAAAQRDQVKALAAERLQEIKNQGALTRTMLAGEYGIKKKAMPAPGATGTDVKDVAEAIIRGEQPPDLKGSYSKGLALKAELARRGYDLGTAQNEWAALQRHTAAANNNQQLRMRQSIEFAGHALDNIEDVYGRWKSLGGANGMKLFNKAELAASKQVSGDLGATAQELETSITDVVEALGNIYMGGNTPTDQAFKLAMQSLQADWNPETFERALDLARKNLRYRANAMAHSGPAGTGGKNRYAPSASGAASMASGEDTVQMKNPQGKVGSVKRSRVEEAKKAGYLEVK